MNDEVYEALNAEHWNEHLEAKHENYENRD